MKECKLPDTSSLAPNVIISRFLRLMELNLSGGQFQVMSKSTSDLAIDNLSGYLQTIHSATDSYICRGGSSSGEMPIKIFYKIDLTTGELVNEVTLTDAGLLISLSAE
jgi:hypothetical protein